MSPRLAFIVAALAVATASTPVAAQDGPVTIGAMYNLTGAQSVLDVPSSQGAQLAVDTANADGGVLGRHVELVVVDGESAPEVIAAQARDLFGSQPAIAGLIGFSDTDMVLAAAPIAAEHGRVFLTSGATSPLLPQEVPGYLFLACFGDNVQAAAGAEWAYSALGARSVAVLYNQGTSYARLLHGYFETRFAELGGVVAASEPYSLEDLAAKAAALPAADLIYLAGQPEDVAAAIPALRDAGFDAPILGGDGLDIGAAWADVEQADGVYFTTHAYLGADNSDPAVQRFRAAFADAHPGEEPDAFTALGYDAAGLLIAAIDAAGSTDPEAVRVALSETTGFTGVTGTINFASGSQIPVKSVTIMAVNEGRPAFVASVLPDRVPPP